MAISPTRPSWLARLPMICLASVALCGCELAPSSPQQATTLRTPAQGGTAPASPYADYQVACERLCKEGPQRCANPSALPSRLQGKAEDPQAQRACTALCVNERKLELAKALPFGPQAALCQHRTNLATLCILGQDCQASPVLKDNGQLNLCDEAFQFALGACQGGSRPGTLL